MYLEHYGIKSKPFSKTPDPSVLFESPAHAEALARMEQAVEDKELMVLTGEIGSGKTTLSRALIDRLPENVLPALIINPRLSPNQLLRTIARRLGEDNPRHFRGDLVEQIHEILFEMYEQEVFPLIIIDEAQAIPNRDTFEEVRLLTNFQLDDRNLMTVILIGQPELSRRLKHPSYEALRQRIGVWFHLHPLSDDQVHDYIKTRLSAAGAENEIFDREAVKAMATLSRGVPRWINNLAASALIEGFGRDVTTIDAGIIMDVAEDLGLLEAHSEESEAAIA